MIIGISGLASETEQGEIPDSVFDAAIKNNGTLEKLRGIISDFVECGDWRGA